MIPFYVMLAAIASARAIVLGRTPLDSWPVAVRVGLAAMFPANVHAARSGHTIAGRPHTPMRLRLPLQLVWIGLLWWSTNRAA